MSDISILRLLALLTILHGAVRAAPSAEVAAFRQAEGKLSGYVSADGFTLEHSAAASRALQAQWSTARALIGGMLDRNPAITLAALARHAGAVGLHLHAIRLDRETYLVVVRSRQFGTAFLSHRGADRHFHTAFALTNPPPFPR